MSSSPNFSALLKELIESGFLTSVYRWSIFLAFSEADAMKTVLRLTPNLFKSTSAEIMEEIIQTNNYYLAEMLLMLGANPKKGGNGRTSIDFARTANAPCQRFLAGSQAEPPADFKGNAISYRYYCEKIEVERKEFFNLLEARGCKLSFSIQNYDAALSAKLYDFAAEILQQANFGARSQFQENNDEISPLSIAAKSQHMPTIEAVMEEYLGKLTTSQLFEAKRLLVNGSPEMKTLSTRIDDQLNQKSTSSMTAF